MSSPPYPGWTPADMPDQAGRVALVTGASSGLGLQTCLELARHGARVLMAGRDPGRTAAAAVRVRTQVPAALVEPVSLDLASLASVREAAQDVAQRVPRLDLLVCNAGIMAPPRTLTVDGFESQLGTNHLGHFALTGLLLPRLLPHPARVVVVSSAVHRSGRIAFDDLMGERSYRRYGAYGQSKLANLLFVRELDRRAQAAGVPLTCVAAHPGYAATSLQTRGRPLLTRLPMMLGNALLAQSAAAGAWPSLYAATMADVEGDDFFGPGGPAEMRGNPQRVGRSLRARDEQAARRLWTLSEELTRVRYDALPG